MSLIKRKKKKLPTLEVLQKHTHTHKEFKQAQTQMFIMFIEVLYMFLSYKEKRQSHFKNL